MSNLTDVRRTLANEVHAAEKRAARQVKAFTKARVPDGKALADKDPDVRPRARDARAGLEHGRA